MGDSMESLDDIMKQINKSMATKVSSKTQELEPRVVQQKEDLLYIKNHPMDWKFNGVLSLYNYDDAKALLISLQE